MATKDDHSDRNAADNVLNASEQRDDSSINSSMSRPAIWWLKVVTLLCLITIVAAWNIRIASTLWNSSGSAPWMSSEVSGRARLAQSGSGSRSGSPAFDLSNVTVPADEILPGGPPKDGIPALTNPRFISPQTANYLALDDRVIGFAHGQEARAYPLKILNFHEIVNDRVGGAPVAITYCPLCDSAAVFDRRTPVGEREFGVSGLLYNSNVLMYDRAESSESLWSQVKSEGISGPGARKSLQSLPIELTTWGDWRTRHPNTLVLSTDTGHSRNYSRSPYAGYFDQPGLMFPASPSSDRLPAKEQVLGVWTENAARAYPVSAFSVQRKRIEDQIDGKKIVIQYNPEASSLRVTTADEGAQWLYSLWFAWFALHPETDVFAAARN